MPDDPLIPSLFNYLQKISSESGLILLSIGRFKVTPFVQETTDSQNLLTAEINNPLSNVQEIDFNITIKGTYSSFKSFLAKIEKSARLIKIENVSFDSKQDDKGVLSFNLIMKTYSY